jgi:hypothetical protein
VRVHLKIVAGPLDGQVVVVRTGESLRFGRTQWAEFSVPHDAHMSSVHFQVECNAQSCRVRDLNSTNGTFLNEQRVVESLLHDGDVIRAGQTQLSVQIPKEAPQARPAAPKEPPKQPARIAPPQLIRSAPQPPVRSDPPQLIRSASQPTGGRQSLIPPQAVKTAPWPPSPAEFAELAIPPTARPYGAALTDPDPLVQREALWAALWTRQPWLLAYLRCLAERPTPENGEGLLLLGILGEPRDLEHVLKIGRTTDLGPPRFETLAAFGHPRVVESLLADMENAEPGTGAAAANAFAKITGIEIDSDRRAAPPEIGPQPDASQQEAPDVQLARRMWQEVKDRFAQGVRWRRGLDVSRPLDADALLQLDLESRRQILLRGAYHGTWRGGPAELERFPQTY